MTKSSLGNVESLFNVNSPFCIEISLRTPENQTMILETWCILFNDQLVDASQKVCYSVYKKMSLVLRSLMCITRCTPTYQLSRRQSSDTYVLFYRMYCGEPIVHHLGENYATAKVGTVGTPIGSILINLAYRTRLTMTPQNSSHLNETGNFGIQIKDDHFVERAQSDSPSSNMYSQQRQFSANDLSSNDQSNSPTTTTATKTRAMSTNSISHDQSFSSTSSLSKRSSSNLNPINEITNTATATNPRLIKSPSLNRTPSKTVPIPMKSGLPMHQQLNQPQKQVSEPNNNDESSTDEYNSSSIASTPDTMYYFKLKSAAFVPSASFNNNYYSSSMGNLNNENDMPPFVTLLSNDFTNTSQLDTNTTNKSNMPDLAQSPPPPQIEYNFRQRTDTNSHDMSSGELHPHQNNMVSPCSLPNFKILDSHLQQHLNRATNERFNLGGGGGGVSSGAGAATSLMGAIPDDFVFIESKKIAFGLSNAANDLSSFFRACENAPILDSFQNEPTLSDTLKDLDQQLLMYESKIAEFDELIKSLEAN